MKTTASQKANAIIEGIDQKWEHLTITDDFVFCKTMLNKDLCRDVLEAILHIHIDRIEYLDDQETIDFTPRTKGIRLDVYVRDAAGTVFNVEMQAVDTRELPRRARYYQSLMTLHQLERGEKYRTLKDAYVIFICNFDLFELGRRVYSFQNRCDDNTSLALGDGAHIVFLSATSPSDNQADAKINELLDYVANGEVNGDLSLRLDKAVEDVRSNTEWRLEYMMLAVRDQLNIDKGQEIGVQLGLEQGRAEGLEQGKAEGLAEGLEQGKAEGLAEGLEQGKAEGLAEGRERGKVEGLAEGLEQGKVEGENKLALLMSALLDHGRLDDAKRCASDSEYRDKLYKEMNIS